MDKLFLKNLWRWSAGDKEFQTNLLEFKVGSFPTLKEIYGSQWSDKFEKLMRNRLAFGYFRYSPLKEQQKGLMDNVGSIKKRIKLFERTGNDELLVDIANICMVEFLNGDHPKKHFKSVDDGVHVERKK